MNGDLKILCTKIFGMKVEFKWKQVHGINITGITSSGRSHANGASHVEFFETNEFSEANEKTDTNISEKFLNPFIENFYL